jgi:Family of unknown function (DUF6459)
VTATLRRLPVPVSEPYPSSSGDWRRPAAVPSTQGALALAFSAAESGDDDGDAWAAPQPTSSTALPDPRASCAVLVQAVVEVLAGTRQPGQLVRWLSADVYTALRRRAGLAARIRQQAAPALTGNGAASRAVVRSVRLCHPADGVVEASAVVVDRGKVRAVAIRLEGRDGRWRATAVQVG